MSPPTALPSRWNGRRPVAAPAFSRCSALLALLACQAIWECRAADGQAAPARIVDRAIQPAGGVGCTTCGPGGCRHGHHAGCRDGVCVPYCPVRPHQFGFYGTQWRRWPGQQIVQVSGQRDAAPVSPPRSAVPGPAEESMGPPEDREAATDAGNADSQPAPVSPPRQPLPEPAVRPAPPPEPGLLERDPNVRPEPAPMPEPAREPAVEPRPETPAAPVEPPAPPAEPVKPDATEPAKPAPEAKPRPEDENLFEVLSGWRARRKFAVGPGTASDASTTPSGAEGLPGAEGLRPAGYVEPPVSPQVPRVPFDAAAETRRLRSAR